MNKKAYQLMLLAGLLLLGGPASAELGGLTKATTLMTDVKTWLLIIGLPISMVVIGGTLIQIKFRSATWTDFGLRCVVVAALGAVGTFVPWLYTYWIS